MDQGTVPKSDFDDLTEDFANLAGKYFELQKKHNRLKLNWERVIEATRKTQYDRETIEEFKQNLFGDRYERN